MQRHVTDWHQPHIKMNKQISAATKKLTVRLLAALNPVSPFPPRMESVGQALEEVLSSALPQGCITVGVYEAAKSLNV